MAKPCTRVFGAGFVRGLPFFFYFFRDILWLDARPFPPSPTYSNVFRFGEAKLFYPLENSPTRRASGSRRRVLGSAQRCQRPKSWY